MCPVCWISGVLFLLFGASALSFGTEWYILIPSFVYLLMVVKRYGLVLKEVRIFQLNKKLVIRKQ